MNTADWILVGLLAALGLYMVWRELLEYLADVRRRAVPLPPSEIDTDWLEMFISIYGSSTMPGMAGAVADARHLLATIDQVRGAAFLAEVARDIHAHISSKEHGDG